MTFSEAMEHRFACRSYQDKQIPKEDLEQILEWGRLTPTSFGWEAWSFHVVEGKRREALCQASFGQESVLQAPVSIVLLARTASFYDPDGPFIHQRASRMWDEQAAIEDFRGFYQMLRDKGELDAWSRSQCYIAAGNMTTGAKTIGIDSVILEGFDAEAVLKVLGLDGNEWIPALVIPFGYAACPEAPKIREPRSRLVVFD